MRRPDFQSADQPPFSAPTLGQLNRLPLSLDIPCHGTAIALSAGVGPAPQGKSAKRDVDAWHTLGRATSARETTHEAI
jgi:hypothetical protein